MAHFIITANFTDQGIKNIKETTKRAKIFRDTAKQMGVTIKEIYWTLGRYDVMLTMEAPDDDTAAALMMKVGAIGNLKSETHRAFSESEVDKLLKKI